MSAKILRQPTRDTSIFERVRFACGHWESTDLAHAIRYYIENHWRCRACRQAHNPVLVALAEMGRKTNFTT